MMRMRDCTVCGSTIVYQLQWYADDWEEYDHQHVNPADNERCNAIKKVAYGPQP